MTRLKVILQSMRLPFLLLTPVCVFLGASFVHYNHAAINYTNLIVVLLGATLAHVSVNMLNEYLDFTSGLDIQTHKTPFSGGSGALPLNPTMAMPVLYTGITTLVLTAVIGIFFVWQQGISILLVGVTGLLLIGSYTPWINRQPFLCLIAPGTGFGVLMVIGTAIILSADITPMLWLISAVPFLLVNNLLLLNQYPDIEPDRAAGRNHFPIAFGVDRSNQAYALSALLAFSAIAISITINLLPVVSLLALLPAPLSLYAWLGARKYGEKIGLHTSYLAANVMVSLLTPLLLGLSLLIG